MHGICIKNRIPVLLQISLLLLCVLFLVLPNRAYAAGNAADYTYELKEDNTAMITGYRGSDSFMIIPAKIDGYAVTEIADSVFSGNSVIESVVILKNIAAIPPFAFQNCTKLSEVILPDSLQVIDYAAFQNTGIKSITLPEKLYIIAPYAFADCNKLQKVRITNPNDKYIDSFAFQNSPVRTVRYWGSRPQFAADSIPGTTYAVDNRVAEIMYQFTLFYKAGLLVASVQSPLLRHLAMSALIIPVVIIYLSPFLVLYFGGLLYVARKSKKRYAKYSEQYYASLVLKHSYENRILYTSKKKHAIKQFVLRAVGLIVFLLLMSTVSGYIYTRIQIVTIPISFRILCAILMLVIIPALYTLIHIKRYKKQYKKDTITLVPPKIITKKGNDHD